MKSSQRRIIWTMVLGVLLLSGCTINRDIMFKTPTDHQFDAYTDTSGTRRFRIQVNDELQFRLFANDGFKMIDLVSEMGGRQNQALMNRNNLFSYFVEYDGLVKLPLLDRVPLAGLTMREAELMLQDRYAEYYNRPYVQLTVINRRVVVFPGGGGDARVIPLENNNTTLLEALAAAGGLNRRGNSHKVKLFRWDPDTGQRKVYQFDLSDISGLQYADIVMQGDDVIYVQPNPDIAREALQDLTPVLTLLTSILLVIGIVQGFQ
jgi:polysaccharide export outer membrane protein